MMTLATSLFLSLSWIKSETYVCTTLLTSCMSNWLGKLETYCTVKMLCECDDISSSEKVRALHAQLPAIKVFVGSDMTRSEGLSDSKYVVTDDGDTPVTLGVQLQADRLKLFLEMDNKAKAEKAANALWQPSVGNRIWYDFGDVKGTSGEFPKNGTFNQYNRTFFYRAIQTWAYFAQSPG